MPINLQWRPNNQPKVSDTPDRLGLEIGGDDDTLVSGANGRVRLFEKPDTSTNKGSDEHQQDRLIATFHGKFFRDASAPVASRLTFDIFIKNPVTPKNHDGLVEGFDPECIFGIDVLIFTFVNRQFVVWLPFHVDSRSEGKFLDIEAVAEIEAGSNFTVLGRSSVLSLGIRRPKHKVDSTSNVNNAPVVYTASLVGNLVTHPEEYLLTSQVQISATQATPAFLPVPTAGGGDVKFQAYSSGSLFVMLTTNLLDDLTPPANKISSRMKAPLADPNATFQRARATLKQKIAATVVEIFTDAGFAGVRAPWQDEAAAGTFNATFTAAFTLRRGAWGLSNSASPFSTSFWNYVAASDSSISGAGAGEELDFDLNTKRNVAGTQAFIGVALPVGSGNKRVNQIIRLNGNLLQDHVLNFSGTARSFADEAEFLKAMDRYAAHIGIIVAHEVGHALGMMHTPFVQPGNYSEASGSPVLSIMSEGVDSGGFGTNLKFAMQNKVMWAGAFGVTPVFADNGLQNKTWQPNEVKTLSWIDRKNRFLKLHGEGGMRSPGFAVGPSGVPPQAKAWPDAQKGTKL